MCGFNGLFSHSRELDANDASAIVARMNRALAHRGPDADRIWSRENVTLGHRRLKVIDLSGAANQPLVTEDRRVAVVFNGEIYNFPELREQLLALGHSFKTRSDTEVLLKAYLEWGVHAFPRFNGIFAFAIADHRGPTPRLLLARDRFGAKPLFYTQTHGEVVFSSELKPLLIHPDVSRQISRSALFEFLKFSHVPNPSTIVEGISQVRPGHALHFEAGKTREWLFRDVLDDAQAAPVLNAETLDRAFREAIERQLQADVPIGCFLSGGIDSSLLIHYLASCRPDRKASTFAVSFEDSRLDEGPFARMVASRYGTHHHELRIGAADLLAAAEALPSQLHHPLGDPSLLPTLMLCREARQQITVAFAGDGGDELFMGYDYHRMLRRLRPMLGVPRVLRRAAFGTADRTLRGLRSVVPSGVGHAASKLLQILQFEKREDFFAAFVGCVGPMPLERIEQLLVSSETTRPRMLEVHRRELRELPFLEAVRKVFLRTFLTDTVLAKSDTAGMAHGLEVRVPFLDDAIVALASGQSARRLMKGSLSKRPLRELLQPHVQPMIWQRPKRGFNIPLASLSHREFLPLLQSRLVGDALRKSRHLDPVQVQRVFDEHTQRKANHSHLLWSLWVFESWRRENHLE